MATSDADHDLSSLRQRILAAADDLILAQLTARAAELCRAPAATISVPDAEGVLLIASHGFSAEHISLGTTNLCERIPLESGVRVVEDMRDIEELAASPLAAPPLSFRFLAGAPLLDQTANQLGALCVLDVSPRVLTEAQARSLLLVAGQVMQRITLLRLEADLEASRAELERASHEASRAGELLRETGGRLGTALQRLAQAPIQAITAYGKLIELEARGSAEEDTAARVAEILGELGRVNGVIESLTSDSAEHGGLLLTEVSAFHLGELLAEVVDACAEEAAQRGVEITTTLANGLDIVRTDRNRTLHILVTLVQRALRATPSGKVSLRVSGDPEHMRIEVRDGGPGMTRGQVERLFDPQPPADGAPPLSAEERARLSEQLALLMCRYYAQLLGGELFAASAPGLGTLVTLSLPTDL